MNQLSRAGLFRSLHDRRPLILPNAWDAGSARIIEKAGASAIATTSAGVAWTYGRRDGQRLTRDEMLDVVARITRTVSVPVTADVEGGYGTGSVKDVEQTVAAVVEAGAVGINLEDWSDHAGGLLDPEVHVERITAAREAARAAGGDVVINARTDVYLYEVGAPETRFDETVRRAKRYRAAGADCVFIPGVRDAATIAALVRAVEGPINIMAGPGSPTISELGALGVARVSLGPRLAEAALAVAQAAARELLESGTYTSLAQGLSFSEIEGLFRT
jgi:2-methylisocitrate lyase-like PEP mutase family enzyme